MQAQRKLADVIQAAVDNVLEVVVKAVGAG